MTAPEVDLSKAHTYFCVAAKLCFRYGASEYISYDAALQKFLEKYFGEEDGPQRRKYLADIYITFLVNILLEIEDSEACEILRDDYATPFVKFNKKALNSLFTTDAARAIEANYRKLGSAGDEWLGSAMASLARRVNFDSLNEFYSVNEAEQSDLTVQEELTGYETTNDVWEPLEIDRTSEDYKAAIEASEKAIREIEASNGYASSEPDERNAIVSITKGTLEAIKTGAPPRDLIARGLLEPFRYIAKKFADSAIGEASKIAFGFLVKWLFG